MSLPYPILGNFTGSIYSGSFLNEQDTSLFLSSQSVDIFFGYSERDVTEISVYDTNDNFISWSMLDQKKDYNKVTLTYVDALNNSIGYTYSELNSQFVIYRSKNILIDPINDLDTIGITDGSYKVSYVFTREMAGNPNSRLVINDISPSRTEIKLLPTNTNNIPYTAFCFKKFPISDISPVLLSVTQNCPYDNIYALMYDRYEKSINFFKNIFFLNDDASVIRFLKNLYEDYIKYTSLTEEQISLGLDPTRIQRIQGIKSYFNNYLLQGNNIIADFDDIENKFKEFTILRIDQAFSQYKEQKGQDYYDAKVFCYDFFVQYFYEYFIHTIQNEHQKKYFAPFKNVLNFGGNLYFSILDHNYLDERQFPEDPLTLVIKLANALPPDFIIKDECWISNFGMSPYVFTAILQNPVKYKTLTIGPPNFGTTTKFINKENVNKLYSEDDLALSNDINNDVYVNKELKKLNTDYSDFNNFIVFSSATSRVNIFKTKMSTYYTLSGSLSEIDTKYNNSLSSSVIYPFYLIETTEVQEQINELISSFDGYESYLFNSKNFIYNITTDSFENELYVENYTTSASKYDEYNRDNLVNNTPEYLTENSKDNGDYLTFLSMVGHHFDNIYTYISALPIEKHVFNQISSSLPTNTLKELLYSFGWNVDDIINNLNVDDVYLNSLNSSTYNVLSAQDRLQIIWNRILVTLPGIYKTKGTEECVKYLMSCYGLPSSLISIREYGGTDSSEDSTPTYKLDEKTYMLRFSGVNDRIEGPFPQSAKTIEFKFSVENPEDYEEWQRVRLFTLYPYGSSESAWYVDIYKTPGQYTGKIALQMGSGSTGATLTSDVLPIFNGKIFSVMVRRKDVSPDFEYNVDSNATPCLYDLTIQRNEDGRKVFYSSTSSNFYAQDNRIFSQYGRFWLSDGTFVGTLDKLNIWDISLDNNDFEEHVNDLNSYGFSGSNAFRNLWVRLNWDYPQSMHTGSPSEMWIDNQSDYFYIPNYRSSSYISSSTIPTAYSASQEIIATLWQTHYPTGSTDIIALNFPEVIDPNWSASYNCVWISSSVYPWHFREYEYQQDIDGSKFGPNKFKNRKIRKMDYSVEARFDSNDRSTFDEHVTVTGESNQIGFFIDPQDSKNKDILRYIGRSGIMELIGDPRNLYKSRYSDLINKNVEYNSFGNKKTLFNEMLTIYKFYFDKSIFEAIKNVVPARANLFTGVVIEPTILERPKYQNKPISSSIVDFITPAVIGNLYNFSMSVSWGQFNNIFVGYSESIDLGYISNPLKIMPCNIDSGIGGYITDFVDEIQFGQYPNFQMFDRQWELSGSLPIFGIKGSTTYDTGMDERLIITSSQRPIYDSINPLANTIHQKLSYMLKAWDKYHYYAKTGEYVRSENPSENLYDSSSIYLYKYIVVSEAMMRDLVYWYYKTNDNTGNSDPSLDYWFSNYRHSDSTFIGTPDQTVSNVYLVPGPLFPLDLSNYTLALRPTNRYFEIVSGYPKNHYTHKMEKFSKTKYGKYSTLTANVIYIKGQQTIDTTVNEFGINDGTYPVLSSNTSNVNVVNASNVIQYTPSSAGTLIPDGTSITPNPQGMISNPLNRESANTPSSTVSMFSNITKRPALFSKTTTQPIMSGLSKKSNLITSSFTNWKPGPNKWKF